RRLGVALGVEEVRRLDVAVALLVMRVHAGDADRSAQRRPLTALERGVEVEKAPTDGGKAHMLDGELHGGVAWIRVPRPVHDLDIRARYDCAHCVFPPRAIYLI